MFLNARIIEQQQMQFKLIKLPSKQHAKHRSHAYACVQLKIDAIAQFACCM